MAVDISLQEARRLAVGAQGFARKPGRGPDSDGGSVTRATPGPEDLRKVASAVQAIQIDSVSVLVRSHYLPAYSRLGPYPMETIDEMAYEHRSLFECWTHAACLVPIERYPVFHYRRSVSRAGRPWTPGRSEPGIPDLERVYEEVAERGPLTASELSEPGEGRGPWWGWNAGKLALEHLFASGLLAIAGRRRFQRLYDLTERVIPRRYLEAPPIEPEEARKQLLCLAARALGAAAAGELIAYFGIDQGRAERPPDKDGKRPRPVGRRLLTELVDEGRLVRAGVEGWREPAYLCPDAHLPERVDTRALLSPFDSLLRRNTQALFGFRQDLAKQLYVPAERRVYGYYVLPFLLGDTIAARCDLKADRKRGALLVLGSFLEPGNDAREVAGELVAELRLMAEWLELERIEIAARGDLAPVLRQAVGAVPLVP